MVGAMRARVIAAYLGAVLRIVGATLLIPAMMGAAAGEPLYIVAAHLVAAVLALLCWTASRPLGIKAPTVQEAMAVCTLSWIVVSGIGALPFYLVGHMAPLDAYFEAVSGFTTTGITMVADPAALPQSLLLWRALTQWLGGLGILTFFLAVVVPGSSAAFQLFAAETHKVEAGRLRPGLISSIQGLWRVYVGLTVAAAVTFAALGMDPFDALAHSLTCLSTGGYSTRAASIAAYPAAVVPAVILFMALGGVNFALVHLALTKDLRRALGNYELKAYALIIVLTTLLVWSDLRWHTAPTGTEASDAAFQVVSVLTTTGFGTRDIGAFPAVSRVVFLVLMVIGGCVGSTGGGLKVARFVLLLKLARRELYRLRIPRRAVAPVVVAHKPVPESALTRIAGMFVLYLALLLVGTLVTLMFHGDMGPFEAASGMFSALGNIGPWYVPAGTQLHAAVKLTYIFGMLAGRLEILPLLVLADPKTWKGFPR